MSENIVSVTTVARHWSEYINRTASCNETFILTKRNQPVAELCPLPPSRTLGELPDILASIPRLSENDAAAFQRDLESARIEVAEEGVKDPWAM